MIDLYGNQLQSLIYDTSIHSILTMNKKLIKSKNELKYKISSQNSALFETSNYVVVLV